jgi:hypothetical protein
MLPTLRDARRLEYLTLAWNYLEDVIAIISGVFRRGLIPTCNLVIF